MQQLMKYSARCLSSPKMSLDHAFSYMSVTGRAAFLEATAIEAGRFGTLVTEYLGQFVVQGCLPTVSEHVAEIQASTE